MCLENNKFAVILFTTCILATYLAMPPCSKVTEKESELQERLRMALKMVKELQKNITKLQLLIQVHHKPTVDYENYRRRVYANTKEFWKYMKYWLDRKKKHYNEIEDSVKSLQDEICARKRSLLSDLEKMPIVDGYQNWRRKEANRLTNLVQRRLRHLQNPPDCRRAKKVVCGHDNCGFGCQLHNIAYCLIFAYATERTLILNNNGWRYDRKGWDNVFQLLSNTCTSTYNETGVPYPASDDAKIILLPVLYYLKPKPKFVPMAIPEDLAGSIIRFNGDPAAWWIGQMIKYILKPRKYIREIINQTAFRMKSQSPVVGVHIRHTDKIGVEAERQDITEYMRHVSDFILQLELSHTLTHRNVYLATDTPSVLDEIRRQYPQYTIHGDASIARSAAIRRRYTPHSLVGLLIDLNMLADTDYLVCTFSSQIGRAVYEMMQYNRIDASTSYSSLDDLYHFPGQNPQERIVILPTNSDGAFQMGDKIESSGIRTGYKSQGKNKSARVPWYKTVENLQLYPFPKYNQVPDEDNIT